ncbi:MAG TPA: zinc ribbon domain-containing protein [Clostridiaceae bacterium]|nr:zinc ribbon domain-containing protein [Clostridiaceae bacterium]
MHSINYFRTANNWILATQALTERFQQLKASPYFPYIVVALAVLIIILLILWMRHVVRRMRRRFRGSMMGQAISMFKQAEQMVNSDEFIDRPRSLNGMDKIYLPLIAEDFPDLRVDQLGNQAQNLLLQSYQALAAVQEKSATGQSAFDELTKKISSKDSGPYYIASFERLVAEHAALGENRPQFEHVFVHNRVLSKYKKHQGKCVIEFQFAVEAMVHSERYPEPEKLQFKDSLRYQFLEDKYLYEDAKGDAALMSFKCPNCGAPLDRSGRAKCAYCGSNVRALQLDTWLPTELLPELWKQPYRPPEMRRR